MSKAHNFRELKIWKESMELVKAVYSITSQLPAEEKFGFSTQLNRCALSIPSNIAEGSGRTSNKEFCHFLNISISSSYELETQLILAEEIFKIDTTELVKKINEIQLKIGAFKRSISN